MRRLAVALSVVAVGCASAPRFPAPRLDGSLVAAEKPVVGADVRVCFVAAGGVCDQPERVARTDERGVFTFERGAWGEVGPYQVLGPSWRLAVADGDQARVLFVGPLIGDPLDTHIEAHCDLSAEPSEACQVVWLGGP
jgi:hypothetical protein